MNTVTKLINRIEARLTETKSPCKFYKSQDKADQVAARQANKLAEYWGINVDQVDYLIVLVPSVQKYAISFDINNIVMNAPHGGYLFAHCDGFYQH